MMDWDALEASIMKHEGYKVTPYLDSEGFWTVGTGKLIEQMPIPPECHTIGELLHWITDPKRHKEWLATDIKGAAVDARTWLGDAFDQLSGTKQQVIVEMCFQLGLGGVEAFVNMKAALLAGNTGLAAREGLNSKWAHQTPGRAKELMGLLA
jgi:GH24 family phage-related lysozyme (muramidase)